MFSLVALDGDSLSFLMSKIVFCFSIWYRRLSLLHIEETFKISYVIQVCAYHSFKMCLDVLEIQYALNRLEFHKSHLSAILTSNIFNFNQSSAQ